MTPVAPLDQWLKRGSGLYNRYSPCRRYMLQKASVAGVQMVYAYPYPSGPKIGGPFMTAQEAWQCCADDAAGSKAS